MLVTIAVELQLYSALGIDGEIQTWFLDGLVVLDHLTDLLAVLSITARGCGEYASVSVLLILGSTVWGVVITAGELLDDELEKKCSAFILSLFGCDCCQTPFWRSTAKKLVHHTEDVVMPFISLGGFIPFFSTMASWAESDPERSKQKDTLAAQIRVMRALVGSAPQFLLTFAYLFTQASAARWRLRSAARVSSDCHPNDVRVPSNAIRMPSEYHTIAI